MDSQAVIDYILENPTSSLGHIMQYITRNKIDIDPAIVIHYKRLCNIISTQKEEIANLEHRNNHNLDALAIHYGRNIYYERLLKRERIPFKIPCDTDEDPEDGPT